MLGCGDPNPMFRRSCTNLESLDNMLESRWMLPDLKTGGLEVLALSSERQDGSQVGLGGRLVVGFPVCKESC